MTREPLSQFVRQLRRTLDADGLAAAPDTDLLTSFRRHRDPAAFETLVRRHGPRVLAACRKVLADPADVEDAFQATFVVLMRDPARVRNARAVGSWLYGVAHRVALKALARRHRREEVEAGATAKRQAAEPDLSWREACAVLHEELDRLPDAYRLPLLLCYLEGLSRDEAARRLGRNLGSVKKALETGRERLRKRLQRRGIALSAGLLAAVAEPTRAGIEPRSVQSVVASAAGGSVSPVVATLARSAGAGPFRAGVGACLAASVVIVCVALGQPTKPPGVASPASPVPKTAPAATDAGALPDRFTYKGRVVGPDGKPVQDAHVFLHIRSPKPAPLTLRAKTDADGRFAFDVKRSEFDFRSFEYSPAPWRWGYLIASAPGLGIAWTKEIDPAGDAELTLPADDASIEGRLLNLQGQPVAGARVRVLWVLRPEGGDLAKWQSGLKGLGDREGWRAVQGLAGLNAFDFRRHGLDPAVPPATTGPDGRFTLKGVGRDRVALVRVEGEGIASRDLFVYGRPGEPKSVDAFLLEGRFMSGGKVTNPQDTFFGTKFDLIVTPSRPVRGVVTDVDTGKPVVGAVVSSSQYPNGIIDRHRAWTATDAEGRYTLHGLPAERGLIVRAEGPAGEPYLAITADVPDRAGLEPIDLNLKLKRGVWLTGTVRDRETKQPVQATVRYAADEANANLKAAPGFTTEYELRSRADDGGFRLPILPGRGYLTVHVGSPDHPRYGIAGDVPADLPEVVAAKPFNISPKSYNAVIPLDPAADAGEIRREVLLTPGKGVAVEVRGPDGEKLPGVIATTDTYGGRPERLGPDGTVTVRGVSARQVKYVQAVCPGKKLAGRMKVTGDDKGPLTLKLQPWLAMKGRVLNEDGQPVAGAELSLQSIRTRPTDDAVIGFWYKGGVIRTDKDGRFQIEGFVPGAHYFVVVKAKGLKDQVLALQADWKGTEPRDLGDVKPRP